MGKVTRTGTYLTEDGVESGTVTYDAGDASPPGSYVVTWKTPDGELRQNQVWAASRDEAIWRLALLMQAARPKAIEFVSCEPEQASQPDA